MAFYRITYNRIHDFATVHNYGCTFKCPVCSYRLKSGPDGIPGMAFPKPERYLSVKEIKDALLSVDPGSVHFMGGEPTVAKALPEILDFVKNVMGAETMLGHTNGSNLSLKDLDGANVGLKAWDENIHRSITGIERSKIYGEFQKAAERGMKLSANIIYIPGLVDTDQVEAAAQYVSQWNIPFHIMGYIPVPGQPYRRPTVEEMEMAKKIAEKHLPEVGYSHLTPEEVLSLERNDDRFDVEVIAGPRTPSVMGSYRPSGSAAAYR